MYTKIKHLFAVLTTLLSVTIAYGQYDDYGLLMKSVDASYENRTSFEVPQDESLSFNHSLDIEFDLRLEQVSNMYGYIMRVVLNNESSVDLLINNINHPVLTISLISDGNMLDDFMMSYDITTDADTFKKWRRVKLSLLPSDNKIKFTCDGVARSYSNTFNTTNTTKILFGLNDKPKFAATDVAPIVIKNLAVSVDRKKNYLWEFKEHGENFVYDKNYNSKLVVNNAEWEIDKHSKWHNILTLRADNKLSPVFDNAHALYAVGADEIIKFDLATHTQQTYPSEFIDDINKRTTNFIYDYNSSCIKAVDVLDENIMISSLDLESGNWNPNIAKHVPAKYTHANLFIAPDSTLAQMFGYGFFRYNSKLYNSKGEVRELGDKISARYLSAVGLDGDKAYIFGGVGNDSGKQELGSKLTNDLYEYDLLTGDITKLWEMNIDDNMEIAAKTLVVNPSDTTKAFALFFSPLVKESYLSLKEINLKEPKIEQILCDKIPYKFHDISSDAMLIYSSDLSCLYAVVTHMYNDGGYELNVYSIRYPILSRDLFYIEPPQDEMTSNSYMLIISVLILLTVVGVAVGLKLYRRGTKSLAVQNDSTEVDTIVIQSNEPARAVKHIEFHPQFKSGGCSKRLPGIYLLGGFCVIDKDNKDITSEFTPLMKQLLSLIILNTQNDGRGISNVKLKELLWYDKSDDRVRNNRGVNINKLRQQLKRVGDFHLNFNKSYWYIEYSDTDYCDYVYATQLLNNIEQISREDVIPFLIEVSDMGLLLINQTVDFFDNYKADYTNTVIDKLNLQLAKSDEPNDKITLSNLIFKYDAVDEDALRIKCKALIDVGKNGIAKTTFDNFTREYELLFGEQYKRSFNEITKEQ